MLNYELYLLRRNKLTWFYQLGSVLGSLVCGLILFLMKEAGMPVSLYGDMMAFFALGAPVYIYSIYAFSWESSFLRTELKDSDYLVSLVNAKLHFNFFVSGILFLLWGTVFYFFLELSTLIPLFIAFVYSITVGNALTLFLTSFQVKRVDLFEDRFGIIRQPPSHIFIVLVNILVYLLITYLYRFYGHSLLSMSALGSFGLAFWLFLKPFMVKKITLNLKNASYAYHSQP
jgi:nicotinamide riboside transporter PnuC